GRIPDDDELAIIGWRTDRAQSAATRRPARHPQSSGAPSRPVDSVLTAHWSRGARHLWSVRRRSAIRVISNPSRLALTDRAVIRRTSRLGDSADRAAAAAPRARLSLAIVDPERIAVAGAALPPNRLLQHAPD